MKDFFDIQKNRAQFLYHGARNWWPIWYFLLNRESRRVWRREAPSLSTKEAEIAARVARDGIAVTHIRDLSPPGTLEELQKEFETKKKKSPPASHGGEMNAPAKPGKGFNKNFMKYVWGGGGTNPSLNLDDPFMKFALDGAVLRIAGTYFDSAPKFHGFSLQETVLVSSGEVPYLSQRWHRDPDDKKIFKTFVYLNNVLEEGSGPFMYVKGSQLGGKWRHFFPQCPPVGRYPDPGAVEKAVPEADRLVCTGTAGTVIFCDTSGLHRGGYSTMRTRAMFAAGFVSKASVHPRNYVIPTSGVTGASSALVRYALSL